MPTDSTKSPAHVRMEAPAELERFTETAWQALLVSCAQLMGWHCTHFRQMIGNPEGAPDLFCFRRDQYRLFELKTVKGILSGRQLAWHGDALVSGVVVHVLRPTEADFERAMDLLQ